MKKLNIIVAIFFIPVLFGSELQQDTTIPVLGSTHLAANLLVSVDFCLYDSSSLRQTQESGQDPFVLYEKNSDRDRRVLKVFHNDVGGYAMRAAIAMQNLKSGFTVDDSLECSNRLYLFQSHIEYEMAGLVHRCQNFIVATAAHRVDFFHDTFSDAESVCPRSVHPGCYDQNKAYKVLKIGSLETEYSQAVKKIVMVPSSNQVWILFASLSSVRHALNLTRLVSFQRKEGALPDKQAYCRVVPAIFDYRFMAELVAKYRTGLDDIQFSSDGNIAAIGGVAKDSYLITLVDNFGKNISGKATQLYEVQSNPMISTLTSYLFCKHGVNVINGVKAVSKTEFKSFESMITSTVQDDVIAKERIAVRREKRSTAIALYRVYKIRGNGIVREIGHFNASEDACIKIGLNSVYVMDKAEGNTMIHRIALP